MFPRGTTELVIVSHSRIQVWDLEIKKTPLRLLRGVYRMFLRVVTELVKVHTYTNIMTIVASLDNTLYLCCLKTTPKNR